MPQDLRKLATWLAKSDWPTITCPVCTDGLLVVDSLKAVPTTEASNRIGGDDWDPDELVGMFHGLLKCTLPKCRERVVVTGEYGEGLSTDHDGQEGWESHFLLRFAIPAIILVPSPTGTPPKVTAAIEAASKLVWVDPNAAANRLRHAIEELLTDYKVPRYRIRNNKRQRISTHARILELKKYEPEVGDVLEAVKWIGNEGSHANELTVADVLDGADLFGHALTLMYDTKAAEFARHTQRINKAKGLPRRRKV